MSFSVYNELKLFSQEIQLEYDLCIRDLGYFHLKDLQHIQDKKVYYISPKISFA